MRQAKRSRISPDHPIQRVNGPSLGFLDKGTYNEQYMDDLGPVVITISAALLVGVGSACAQNVTTVGGGSTSINLPATPSIPNATIIGGSTGSLVIPATGGGAGIVAPRIPPVTTNVFNVPNTTSIPQSFSPVFVPLNPNSDSAILNLGVPTDRISRVWYFPQPAQPGMGPIATKFAPVVDVMQQDTNTFSIRHSGNANFTVQNPTDLHVMSGDLIVIAHQPLTIDCGEATVTQQPNTIVQIIVTPNSVLVRTLLDERSDCVQVAISGGENFVLPISNEICVGRDEAAVGKALKGGLPRKDLIMTQLKDGRAVSSCSFLLPALTAQDSVLLSMYRKRIDQPLVSKLLKTAACLQLTSYSRGAYRVMD
jgi:hypothetical protein